MILPQYYASYFQWLTVLLLDFISKLGSYYHDLVDSFRTCSVEIWGPKRYSSTKLEDETSYELHHDRLYLHLLDYLSTSNSSYLSCPTIQRHVSADNYFRPKEGSTAPTLYSSKKPVVFGPQYDHPHKILYKGETLTLTRTQLPRVTYDDYPYEKIRISSKLSHRPLIYDLLTTALKTMSKIKSTEGTLQILKPDEDPCPCCPSSWEEMGEPRTCRPLDSVILADGLQEKLVQDLKDFIKSREFYDQREIPYTRGYLLYGPPGSGKSSLVKALASHLRLQICLLSLAAKDLNDFTLSMHLNSAPEKSLILLEDIDTAFKSREDEFADTSEQQLSFGGASCSSTVTFSGLLNALDGVLVGGADGRIIFMTTNHVDRLDPALIRPGRIDLKICLDYPTDSQIKRLHNRFYKNDEESEAEVFLDSVRCSCGDVKVTMAMVQGLLMMNRDEKNVGVGWYRIAKDYFRDQACPYQRDKHLTWGLYV